MNRHRRSARFESAAPAAHAPGPVGLSTSLRGIRTFALIAVLLGSGVTRADGTHLGAFPSYEDDSRHGEPLFGYYLLKHGVADVRDVPEEEIVKRADGRNLGGNGLYQGLCRYAGDHGYAVAVPTGEQAIYNGVRVFGAFLVKREHADFKDIPADELRRAIGGADPGIFWERMKAAARVTGRASVPTFEEAVHDGRHVYGIWSLKPSAYADAPQKVPAWLVRMVSGANSPGDVNERFVAINRVTNLRWVEPPADLQAALGGVLQERLREAVANKSSVSGEVEKTINEPPQGVPLPGVVDKWLTVKARLKYDAHMDAPSATLSKLYVTLSDNTKYANVYFRVEATADVRGNLVGKLAEFRSGLRGTGKADLAAEGVIRVARNPGGVGWDGKVVRLEGRFYQFDSPQDLVRAFRGELEAEVNKKFQEELAGRADELNSRIKEYEKTTPLPVWAEPVLRLLGI